VLHVLLTDSLIVICTARAEPARVVTHTKQMLPVWVVQPHSSEWELGIRQDTIAELVGSNTRTCLDFIISYYYSTPTAEQGKNNIQFHQIHQMLTAFSVDGVTLNSCSGFTVTNPRSNQITLFSSRLRDDPVYCRTVGVVAAVSLTGFNGRSRRLHAAISTIVIFNCPRHTV